MSEYIIDAIQKGVLETFQMTFFSALFAYLVGLPLGVLLSDICNNRTAVRWHQVRRLR